MENVVDWSGARILERIKNSGANREDQTGVGRSERSDKSISDQSG